MSAPDPAMNASHTDVSNSKLLRAAMWVAIGALIAAAIVCVVWVLVGSQNGLIARAFLTIVLLAGFAAAAILDARLASSRPPWFTLTSMVVWVVTLLIGAFLIWMPESDRYFYDGGVGRFISFLLIVLVLQLALLHVRLFSKAIARRRTRFTTPVGYITIGLVALLAVMLVLPLMLNEWVEFHEIYWRLVVAVTILAAVGTALVPLVNALFAPRRPRPVTQNRPQQQWPTYVDGVTPLPLLPDGSPDWNAYYTGYPSVPQPGGPSQPWAQPASQQWGQPSAGPQGWGPPVQQQWAPAPHQQVPISQPPDRSGYPPPPPLPQQPPAPQVPPQR